MIAYVKGTLEEIGENLAVVDVGGVGYNVKISSGTMGRLPGLHQAVKLYTYTSLREDDISLYGFLTREDLRLFGLLITVNGVGPKGALGILSVMSAEDLRFAIASADSKMLARAPGVGRKTAERIILDLRDKIGAEHAPEGPGEAIAPSGGESVGRREAVEALVALGYGGAEALKAVGRVKDVDETDTEAILRAALKLL